MPEIITDTMPWLFDLARFDDDNDEGGDEETGSDENAADGAEEDGSADQSNSGDEDTSEDTDGDDETDDKKRKADDGLGDKGKQAIARMKAERDAAARDLRKTRKELKDARSKVDEFEDRDRTELEKATKRAETLEKRIEAATARSVRSEVKALATEKFEDPSDATAFLDLTRYADADGDVDTDQIAADIEELLEKKPHLAKRKAKTTDEDTDETAESGEGRRKAKPKPKADRGQGSRGSDLKANFRDASPEEVAAEQAKYGFRPRR